MDTRNAAAHDVQGALEPRFKPAFPYGLIPRARTISPSSHQRMGMGAVASRQCSV